MHLNYVFNFRTSCTLKDLHHNIRQPRAAQRIMSCWVYNPSQPFAVVFLSFADWFMLALAGRLGTSATAQAEIVSPLCICPLETRISSKNLRPMSQVNRHRKCYKEEVREDDPKLWGGTWWKDGSLLEYSHKGSVSLSCFCASLPIPVTEEKLGSPGQLCCSLSLKQWGNHTETRFLL